MAKLPSYTVIRDTREKDGWTFDPEEKVAGKMQVLGTVEQGLPAGDYSLLGFEDQIIIERKNGFCELFGNMTPVANRERFEREMEKLRSVPHKFILVETNVSKDTMGLSVPQFKFSPPASAVIKWLSEIEMEYGIHVKFVGDCGKKMARILFESFLKRTL